MNYSFTCDNTLSRTITNSLETLIIEINFLIIQPILFYVINFIRKKIVKTREIQDENNFENNQNNINERFNKLEKYLKT